MNNETSRCEAPAPSDRSGAVRWMKQCWSVVRELVGDDAYERYCAHHGKQHAHEALLSREAFYMKNQQEKWSGIKRCC